VIVMWWYVAEPCKAMPLVLPRLAIVHPVIVVYPAPPLESGPMPSWW
jgi:hypothetical protein